MNFNVYERGYKTPMASWNACDGEATLTFSYDPLLTYDVNWGDGNNETITSGNVTHSYTPGSSYNVIVTASNFAGSNPSSASNLNALALMAPDAIFTLTQTGASVAVSVDNDLPCNTYSWTWGDNTNNSSGSSETHLYTATGTYTLELYAQNSAGSNTKTREVVINVDGVDEIDFVNGISEIELVPGIFGKFGLNFEYSPYDNKLKALEVGVAVDLFYKEVPLMYSSYNNQYWVTFYLMFEFGKKIE